MIQCAMVVRLNVTPSWYNGMSFTYFWHMTSSTTEANTRL